MRPGERASSSGLVKVQRFAPDIEWLRIAEYEWLANL
jgi:hypothetical protein